MLKKLMISVLISATLILSSCRTPQHAPTPPTSGAVPSASNHTGAPEASITETSPTPESTAPVTSDPIDTSLQHQDIVPDYDTNAADTIVLHSQASALNATYIHLFTSAAHAFVPFDGNVFLIHDPHDGTEMNQGSRYLAYALEEDGLKQLENKVFSRRYSFLGQTVSLYFTYAEYAGQYYITYIPVNDSLNHANLSRTGSIQNCLMRFTAGTHVLYGIVDLNTGALQPLLTDEEAASLDEQFMDLYHYDHNGGLVLTSAQHVWLIQNGNAADTKKYDPADYLPNNTISSSAILDNGILWIESTPGIIGHATVWKLDFDTGSISTILTDVSSFHMRLYDSYATYRRGASYCVFDFTDNREYVLDDTTQWVEHHEKFVAFKIRTGQYQVFDLATHQIIDLPETASTPHFLSSKNGDYLAMLHQEDAGVYQIVILEAGKGMVAQIHRSNPNNVQESYFHWTEDDSFVIYSAERSEFYLYQLVK